MEMREIRKGTGGAGQQVLRLAHAALLDVLRDGAVVDLFETALEFRGSHAGDLRQPLHGDFRRIVVAQVGSYRLNALQILG